MSTEQTRTGRARAGILCPLVLFVLAFMLRSCGLSHDLDQGLTYHPDTPKQARKAEQVAAGVPYLRVSHRDYDGYPFFNSHLAAYAFRVVRAADVLVRDQLGLPQAERPASDMTILWVIRWINVMASSGAVLLIYLLGLRLHHRRVACAGAFLLAISPLDVVAPHFATGDATAAFFALVAVVFAVRVYRSGALFDYALATAAAVLAFSTKYHAGMAALAIVAAHVMRFRGFRALFGRASLGRAALCVVVAVAAFCLTTPSVFINAKSTLRDIVGFLRYTSNFKLPPELEDAGPAARLLRGFQQNVPMLAESLSPWFLVIALAGLAWGIVRSPEERILAVVPVTYLVVGLAAKPVSFAVYYTLITPYLALAGAAVLDRLHAARRWHHQGGPLALAAFALSALYLAHVSWREDFFFSHQDTSRMARDWTEQNVPPSFELQKGRYTFDASDRPVPEIPDGAVLASSSFKPIRAPERHYLPVRQMDLADRSLGVFRNPAISLFLGYTDWISAGFTMPTFQQLPSLDTDRKLILEEEAAFYRSDKLWWLTTSNRVDSFVVAREPLKDVLIGLRAGDRPSRLKLSFGGHALDVSLAGGEARWVPVLKLRRSLPLIRGRHLYRIRARALAGRVRMVIATTPAEKAVLSYGLTPDYRGFAHEFYLRNLTATNPTLLMIQYLADRQFGGVRPVPGVAAARGPTDEDFLRKNYGVSMEYLDALDYLSFAAAECGAVSTGRTVSIVSPALMLEPGRYRAFARVVCPEGRSRIVRGVRIRLTDPGRRVAFAERSFDRLSIPPGGLNIELPFPVSPEMAEMCVSLALPREQQSLLQRIVIRPDTLGTVDELRRLCRAARPAQPTEGNVLPRTVPAEACIATWHGRNYGLYSYVCGGEEVARGASWPLDLRWSVERVDRLLPLVAVWVHLVDTEGKTALAFGHNLQDDLTAVSRMKFDPPRFNSSVLIPEDLPKGTYDVVAGLFVPAQHRRLDVSRTDLPVRDHGVVLAKITVTE